jgi:6-phospho-beta-glucosidase
VHIGEIPEGQYLLIRTIKRYEKLAVQAIMNRDKMLATEALATHPLIGSYSLGAALVGAFAEAHRDIAGVWK